MVLISWFLFTRKDKAKSAEVYVGGLRCLHLINGHENPALKSKIVKLVLSGQMQLEKLADQFGNKPKRVAVTMHILKLIKKNLIKSNFDYFRQHPICGGFCIHELLARDRQRYDPTTILLEKDVVMKENVHRNCIENTQKR